MLTMQIRHVIALLRISLAVTILAAPMRLVAGEFPYSAYVVVDEADVVAGPGHRFYATTRLARGAKVEIYREEASGWLAIRPPEGSFSWVPADFIEPLDDTASKEATEGAAKDSSMGRAKEPAAVWIGTEVEHVEEHREQVMLKAGELVQILGEKTAVDRGGREQRWLRIAPPAGEYRWIYLRDVSRQPPEASSEMSPREERQSEIDANESAPEAACDAAQVSPQPDEPRRFRTPESAIAIHDLAGANAADRRIALAQFRSSRAVEHTSLSSDGFVPRKRRETGQLQPSSASVRTASISPAGRQRGESAAPLATATRPTALPAAIASPLAGGILPDEIARQLDQLDIDLSLMLASDRSQWNLAPLRQRIETLVERGSDPVGRGRARLMLEKLAQFEQAFAVPNAASMPETTLSMAAPASTPTSALAEARYDAQGWLKEVVSRKGNKPAAPYAIVDSQGQPLAFISPSPGLNLNRYLNKQVGLYGRRGYLEELKKPHVLAERVIELDRQRR